MGEHRWLNCRLADIQGRLNERGHGVSQPVISRLLKQNDYTLKANVKQKEGKRHPDRDQQFGYIHEQRAKHQANGQPRISVDTKKKELVGDFKNSGQVWCQAPEQVSVHDFPSDAVGRAAVSYTHLRAHET